MPETSRLYIGLMSGTSMDGVDGVLASFSSSNSKMVPKVLASAYQPFPTALRDQLMALQAPGHNEIHREAVVANELARLYADCVADLVTQSKSEEPSIQAIGVHGQTIRHRPESGYTRQVNNPALLAELTGIDVVADFRSRDIAAGGQGAPLTPAFHAAVFEDAVESRVVVNIGGIGNITVLNRGRETIGFDTGPGNVLMDAWIGRHKNKAFDDKGNWAASGSIIPALLQKLLDEPFLKLPPPKSTGRDLFHEEWLNDQLSGFEGMNPADIQATLAAFTAFTIADAITTHAPDARAAYVCGGGAYNMHLLSLLQQRLSAQRHAAATVHSIAALGVPPNHVEALAFAWLAHQHVERTPANLPAVTGAIGSRILGALHPA